MSAVLPSRYHAPQNPRKDFQYTMHGVEIRDDFQWLEHREDSAVHQWTAAQHAATQEYFGKYFDQFPTLHKEITELYDCDRDYEPFAYKGHVFFYRRRRGAAQRVLCTRVDEADIMLFDPVEWCQDSTASIHSYQPNMDARMCAIAVQYKGAETLDIVIVDSQTGEQIGEELKSVRDFSWSRDSASCFFKPIHPDSLERQEPWTIVEHVFGQSPAQARVIHRSTDPKHHIFVQEFEHSSLRLFVTYVADGAIVSTSGSTDSAHSLPADSILYSSTTALAVALPRKEWMYWFSLLDAPNGRILRSPINQPRFEDASDLIPEGKQSITDFAIADDYLFVCFRIATQSVLKIYRADGSFVMEAELPEPSNISSIMYAEHDNCLYVSASSYCSAPCLYRMSLGDWVWTRVWSDVTQRNLTDWHTRYLDYPSKDGTMVPLCVTCRRDLVLDGSHPLLLSGYGGFGIGVVPRYSAEAVSFLYRGGIIAQAGIRGGDEYGEEWHRAAMRDKKQNCFDDFISAAEFLIREGYTASSRLAIRGGSNGGLLVGAVSCQRPDLFAAVECDMPLLDMVRYVQFSIARFWISEYGDPDIEADFRVLYGYSPYHQLHEGLNLPPTLVSVAAHDTRTDPLHGKKFVAAAQSLASQTNHVMLWVDYNSGHQGGTPTQSLIHDSFVHWLFLLTQLGMVDEHAF